MIDEIVQEPVGGAHRRPDEALTALGDSIEKALKILLPQNGKDLKAKRREKFLAMGKIGLS